MIDIRGEVLDMKKNINEIQGEQQSFAMELFQDYKKVNSRWFVCWLITFMAFCALLIYTITLHNDIATIETTEVTQDTESGYNNYIGNDGDIINGEAKD